jgi:hypothetical protein
MLQDGKIGWLEMLIDPWGDYGPASQQFIQEWEAQFPNELVVTVGDDSEADNIWYYTSPVLGGGMPQGGLIDANYNWETLGIYEGMAAAVANYN